MARCELLTQSQIRRAVISVRRSVKQSVVTPSLVELEADIEQRYSGWLPIAFTQPRAKNGRFRPHPELGAISEATRGYYRPAGLTVLSRNGGCGLDEVADAAGQGSGSGMDIASSVNELAGKLATGRWLRGFGGRHAMLSRGLDSHWAQEFGDEHSWWLTGTAEEAAQRVAKELRSCLLISLSVQNRQLARREVWYWLDEGATDFELGELTRVYGWFDEPATELLETLITASSLTWRAVLMGVLGMSQNRPPHNRKAPAPYCKVLAFIPAQRKANEPALAASA